jgi:phage tail protein X
MTHAVTAELTSITMAVLNAPPGLLDVTAHSLRVGVYACVCACVLCV